MMLVDFPLRLGSGCRHAHIVALFVPWATGLEHADAKLRLRRFMAMPASSAGRVLRFGVFELDVSSGELRKSGVKLRLQEQPFQILAVLLEQPGEIVSRDQLRERLWPADTFVDF